MTPEELYERYKGRMGTFFYHDNRHEQPSRGIIVGYTYENLTGEVVGYLLSPVSGSDGRVLIAINSDSMSSGWMFHENPTSDYCVIFKRENNPHGYWFVSENMVHIQSFKFGH